MLANASLKALVGASPLVSTLASEVSTSLWICVSYGPIGCCFNLLAELPKIWPIGALLKYTLVAAATAGSWAAVDDDGKCCCDVHIVICCAGAVSHSASASAAAWFFPAFGTPSHEPPQFAAPPGRFAMSQSPDTAWPACEVM